MSVAILILAGGASRRMGGRDKLLEPVEGQPNLRRLAVMALGLSDDVVVALRPGAEARKTALEGLAVTLIEPAGALEGMGGTMRDSFAALADRAAVLMVLGDMPEITANDMARVMAARQARPDALIWRGATGDGTPGHPILFDARLFEALRRLSGDDGGRDVAARHAEQTVLVPLPGTRARLDLDTARDWDEWHARQARGATRQT